jgi:hypothetical protein
VGRDAGWLATAADADGALVAVTVGRAVTMSATEVVWPRNARTGGATVGHAWSGRAAAAPRLARVAAAMVGAADGRVTTVRIAAAGTVRGVTAGAAASRPPAPAASRGRTPEVIVAGAVVERTWSPPSLLRSDAATVTAARGTAVPPTVARVAVAGLTVAVVAGRAATDAATAGRVGAAAVAAATSTSVTPAVTAGRPAAATVGDAVMMMVTELMNWVGSPARGPTLAAIGWDRPRIATPTPRG